MKKHLSVLLLMTLIISVLLSVTTFSAVTPKVYDMAKLFTKIELEELEKRAVEVSEQYKLDIVIVTIDENGGKTSREFADDFYDINGFGYGENGDGILLLINMEDREAYISTCGIAIQYFTDERIEAILDVIYTNLAEGKFGSAADSFIYEAEYYIKNGIPNNQYTQSENGTTVPENNSVNSTTPNVPGNAGDKSTSTGRTVNPEDRIPIFVAISFVIAGIFTLISVKKHNYVPKTNEASYLDNGSINLIHVQDNHVDTRRTQRVIPKNPPPSSSGHSGRSTVHTSSSGRTHGGGGRSFGSGGGGGSTHTSGSGRTHGGGGRKF